MRAKPGKPTDEMRPEYDFTGKKGVRGKYYQAYRQGHTIFSSEIIANQQKENSMPKYYGTPAYDQVYELLKSLACKGGPPIGYSPIYKIMNLKSGQHAGRAAGSLLGEISERTHQEGKPMLSALVINQQEGMPGKGFFSLAIKLGKLPAGVNSQAEKAFWENELKAVYAAIW